MREHLIYLVIVVNCLLDLLAVNLGLRLLQEACQVFVRLLPNHLEYFTKLVFFVDSKLLVAVTILMGRKS